MVHSKRKDSLCVTEDVPVIAAEADADPAAAAAVGWDRECTLIASVDVCKCCAKNLFSVHLQGFQN